jgi:hypothetical protein
MELSHGIGNTVSKAALYNVKARIKEMTAITPVPKLFRGLDRQYKTSPSCVEFRKAWKARASSRRLDKKTFGAYREEKPDNRQKFRR